MNDGLLIEDDSPAPEPITDGVYFNMDEDVYHALPRLSASGIKKLMISAGDFWASSWLNPDKEETDRTAFFVGSAYHTARLEPEIFREKYTPALSQDDIKGVLTNDTEVKAALAALGEPQTQKGELAGDRADRLLLADPTAKIWAREHAEWKRDIEAAELTPLPGEVWDQITADMGSMDDCPRVQKYLRGGAAEVSVLWTDETTGIPMKCRIDYLKSSLWADLKTFASKDKPLPRHIADAFRYNGYYISSIVQREAVQQIRDGLPAMDTHYDIDADQMCADIAARETDLECAYVYLQKLGVPNTIASPVLFHVPHKSIEVNGSGISDAHLSEMKARAGNPSIWFLKGQHEIAQMLTRFLQYSSEYEGNAPWKPLGDDAVVPIHDGAFGSFWLEGEWF